ncbi:hypothetical protein K458DRAFT_419823 [Lentithecium fluviatile CBS 122367]|uniref:Uncharacterized protein n=1 Tax=Lentithecium fluviatile CBS 122367 TaxID=1168545 RepID=A0A6G1IWD9_9PLEO|nr:hypothetical protein K458DRAFT_419823 [Lentithecium fluviatile CBS 122367]
MSYPTAIRNVSHRAPTALNVEVMVIAMPTQNPFHHNPADAQARDNSAPAQHSTPPSHSLPPGLIQTLPQAL